MPTYGLRWPENWSSRTRRTKAKRALDASNRPIQLIQFRKWRSGLAISAKQVRDHDKTPLLPCAQGTWPIHIFRFTNLVTCRRTTADQPLFFQRPNVRDERFDVGVGELALEALHLACTVANRLRHRRVAVRHALGIILNPELFAHGRAATAVRTMTRGAVLLPKSRGIRAIRQPRHTDHCRY